MALTLRTDAELDRAITELAEAEGTSKQEAIRRAVIEKRDRTTRSARLDAISRDMLVEWADVLDRLGKA
ncbi:MAG: ribbon-helix-helix protein, CopG family [Marmoricola sp.]